MKKAVYFDILNYTRENLELLRDHFEVVQLPDPSALSPEVLKGVSVLFAPLGYHFGAEIFSQAPELKAVATNTTGVPHIDLGAAESRNIKVLSLKDEQAFLRTITPTAELTLGLMISVVRNIIPARESVLQGRWRRWDFGGVSMLSRMSLGIVGLGRLGAMVAGYARALGMKVSYYDPFVQQGEDQPYRRMESLAGLVGGADIISVHIPMNEQNRHLFNREIFRSFRKGAYFINTARGEVVDSLALIEALESGTLRGAALDVLDGEFDPDFSGRVLFHPLVAYAQTHPNLIITPHIAGSTEDAWSLTQRHVIEQVISSVNGSGERA